MTLHLFVIGFSGFSLGPGGGVSDRDEPERQIVSKVRASSVLRSVASVAVTSSHPSRLA